MFHRGVKINITLEEIYSMDTGYAKIMIALHAHRKFNSFPKIDLIFWKEIYIF